MVRAGTLGAGVAGAGGGTGGGAAAGVGLAAGLWTLQGLTGLGGFTSGILVLTKTVKVPGASAKVALPQRLGVLRPSRRMRSTLKVFELDTHMDSLATLSLQERKVGQRVWQPHLALIVGGNVVVPHLKVEIALVIAGKQAQMGMSDGMTVDAAENANSDGIVVDGRKDLVRAAHLS